MEKRSRVESLNNVRNCYEKEVKRKQNSRVITITKKIIIIIKTNVP
jgi:hypothetical protein